MTTGLAALRGLEEGPEEEEVETWDFDETLDPGELMRREGGQQQQQRAMEESNKTDVRWGGGGGESEEMGRRGGTTAGSGIPIWKKP